MKKYQRLLLVIISIISISLFLVYRQEYNRLHHVLEVFNFFGTPCNVTELQRSDGMLLEHDWGAPPMWKEVDNKQFLYSAFLLDKNKVRGIAVRHVSRTVPKTCLLFFEDDNKPVKGKLSESKIANEESAGFVAFIYSCTFTNNNKQPYAIAFKPNYAPTPITNNLGKKLTFNSTVCVVPTQFSKKSLLEFLSFHNLLGVESFIIYHEDNIPYRVIKLLKNLSSTLNMWFNVFSFNLPLILSKDITRVILEHDCQLRTKSQSKYSLVLGINDYTVPSQDNTKSKSTRLPIKRFCLNHINNNRPMVLQNFELIDDYRFNSVLKLNKNNLTEAVKDLRRIPNVFEISCVIYRYEKCEKGIKTKTDFSMKRFSTDLTRSTLVQLLIHEGF